MNQQPLDFNSVQSELTKANNVLVLIPANPSLEKAASALALYLSLIKANKKVVIACPSEMTVAFNRLFAVSKIRNQMGNRNLIISFDYQKDSIEKVSYNIENNKFNLVIEPRSGKPSLDPEKVVYSYSGAEADLIFVIGASKLEDLAKLYQAEQKVFDKTTTINIDTNNNNTKFGKINLVDSQFSSCSELVTDLIRKLNLPVDQDIATNLFVGLKTSTSNFQSPRISANTFEIAAWCLKQGANKKHSLSGEPVIKSQSNPTNPIVTNQSLPQKQPQAQAQPEPAEKQSAPFQVNTSQNEVNVVKPPFSGQPGNQDKEPGKQPPPDWFKPKIFKGGTTV